MRLPRGRKQREVTWLREHKTRDDQQERKGRDADVALKVQHTKQKRSKMLHTRTQPQMALMHHTGR